MITTKIVGASNRYARNELERAACRGLPFSLFFFDEEPEPEYPPPEIRQYCDMCPVRTECLQIALDHDENGVWGGTTKTQRDKMKRKLSRVHCVNCNGTDSLIIEGNRQLCLACGVSWLTF